MLQVKGHLFQSPADMYEFIKKNATNEVKYLIDNHLSAKRHLNDIILLANDAPIKSDREIADYLQASITCYPKHASEDYILTPEAIQQKLDGKRQTTVRNSVSKRSEAPVAFSPSSLIAPVTVENDEELRKLVENYKELHDKQSELLADENSDELELARVTKAMYKARTAVNEYKNSHMDYTKLDEYINNQKANIDDLQVQEEDIKEKRERLGIRLGRVHASLTEARKNLKDAETYKRMKMANSSETAK